MENKFSGGGIMPLSHYIYRVAEEFCKKFHIIKTYETSKGLKNINMGKVATLETPYVISHIILNSTELFLGPDFLKDQYTLLGKTILDSPHYQFMQAMLTNKPLEQTEYVKRWLTGTLDWRRSLPLKNQCERWKASFESKMKEVETGKYSEIWVYAVNGKYFIYDGKHRAALCAVLGKPIHCSVISDQCVYSFYGRYMMECICNKEDYNKHRLFLDRKLSELSV